MTDAGDSRSLTYAELGASRGISTASAKRLALRHGWHKTPGNDGLARITVPAAALVLPTEQALGRAQRHRVTPPVTTPAISLPVTSDTSPETSAVTLVAELRRRAEAGEQAAKLAEGERDTLAKEVIVQRERTARAEGEAAASREAVARERVHFEQALGRAERAEQEAARLRDVAAREAARADAERGARQAAEAGRDIAQAAAQASERRWEAAEAVLASRNTDNPLVRAWRAFWQGRR